MNRGGAPTINARLEQQAINRIVYSTVEGFRSESTSVCCWLVVLSADCVLYNILWSSVSSEPAGADGAADHHISNMVPVWQR